MTHNQIRHFLRGLGLRIGQAEAAILNQDDDFINWLLNQTTQGATVSETLVAIAVDAYHEENHE